jgi:hypothetical protein
MWGLILWRSAVQLFYVAVVLFVFSRLHDRLEFIIVALFGLTYVAVQGLVTDNARALMILGQWHQREFDSIKRAVVPGYQIDSDSRKDEAGEIASLNQRIWFERGGHSAIAIICLYYLFTTVA